MYTETSLVGEWLDVHRDISGRRVARCTQTSLVGEWLDVHRHLW